MYQGDTKGIDCSKGGFCHDPNIDAIPPYMMIEPSRNINIHENGWGKRGGTSKINGTAISGSPKILGIYDFTLRNGNQFIMLGTNDGKLYKDATTTIKTGLTLDAIPHMMSYENELYFCNGKDTPQTWDGVAATTSNITNPSADWTGTNQPKQFIKHTKGNSERLWAVGFTDGAIYASASGNGKEFVTGALKIVIDTGDGYGIVGGVEFQNKLLLFGKRQAYFLDDSDATPTNWSYYKAAFEGGAANFRCIVKIPNDVLVMEENCNIYSIMAMQETGDYKAASISKPAFIDRWIREFIKVSDIANFHAVHDSVRRCVLFFMTTNGSLTPDIALPYFYDRPAAVAWGAPMTSTSACGYHALSACEVRVSEGVYQVYTGDASGFYWKLETSNANDDSVAYNGVIRTPYWGLESPFTNKHFWRGRVVTQTEGNFYLQAKTFIDGVELTEQSISLGGIGAQLDSFILDTDVLSAESLVDTSFQVGAYGKRIQHELYNNQVNESFFVSQLMEHYRDRGVRV